MGGATKTRKMGSHWRLGSRVPRPHGTQPGAAPRRDWANRRPDPFVERAEGSAPPGKTCSVGIDFLLKPKKGKEKLVLSKWKCPPTDWNEKANKKTDYGLWCSGTLCRSCVALVFDLWKVLLPAPLQQLLLGQYQGDFGHGKKQLGGAGKGILLCSGTRDGEQGIPWL